ncbi:MAG: hypothetical protein ACLUEK_04775 [Oscillospiraceae bacterium]
MLVSSIDYNEFVGRIAIGRIERVPSSRTRRSRCATAHDPDAAPKKAKATALYEFDGQQGPRHRIHRRQHHRHERHRRRDHRGHHLRPRRGGAHRVQKTAPTIEMTFSVNDSPLPDGRSPPASCGSG